MNSAATARNPSMAAGLLVWGFGATFYLSGFFHRVAPAVITDELMRDFQINASALGSLSAFYFYSYVAMQIPTGILADRWGPRRLFAVGSFISAIGAILFAIAPGMGMAAAGRLLIGGSVAVAWVGLLKIAANWFAPSRFAFLTGLALLFGIIGAVFAGAPLRVLVNLYGWRALILSSAVVAVAIGIANWLCVRDFPHEKGFLDFEETPSIDPPESGRSAIADLLQVLKYRNTRLLFFIPGGIVGSVLTFSGLWGVPFLTKLHQISAARAGALTSLLMVAMAVGGPFFGWLSDRLGNRKKLYLIGCGVSIAGWIMLLYPNGMPIALLVTILLITGFSSGAMIISFAFVKESVPARLGGTVSGVINMGVMIGPMLLQPAVGWVLDRLWTGEVAAGVRVYSANSYRWGFSIMLAWVTLSWILLLFTRETGCRQGD